MFFNRTNHTQTKNEYDLYFFAIMRCLTETDMLLSETSTYADMKSFG